MSEVRRLNVESTPKADSYCADCDYPLPEAGPCLRCADIERERHIRDAKERSEMIRALGGRRPFEDFTFDRLEKTARNRDILAAAKAFDPAQDNLFISGPPGSGKSHIMTAAVRGRMRAGHRIAKASEILRVARRAIRDGGDEGVVIDYWAAMGVLGIDDLGVEKDTEFAVQIIYEIVDARWMDKRNGLVITSNLTLNELAEKLSDDRVTSRLYSMCKIFNLRGERDFRARK